MAKTKLADVHGYVTEAQDAVRIALMTRKASYGVTWTAVLVVFYGEGENDHQTLELERGNTEHGALCKLLERSEMARRVFENSRERR